MKLTRRDAIGLAISTSALIRGGSSVQAADDGAPSHALRQPMHCNIITVPDMVQLDITGPFEVLARTPGWTVDLVAATMDPAFQNPRTGLCIQHPGVTIVLTIMAGDD